MPELEDLVDEQARHLAERLTGLFKKPWLPHEGELETSYERRGHGPESTSGLGLIICVWCDRALRDHGQAEFCYLDHNRVITKGEM